MPHLVSTLPAAKSPDTERILRSFGAKPLVDFRDCLFRSGHTEAASSYIFRSEATGSRTLVNYNGLPEMTLQEFADIAKGFKHSGRSWWHFEVSWLFLFPADQNSGRIQGANRTASGAPLVSRGIGFRAHIPADHRGSKRSHSPWGQARPRGSEVGGLVAPTVPQEGRVRPTAGRRWSTRTISADPRIHVTPPSFTGTHPRDNASLHQVLA